MIFLSFTFLRRSLSILSLSCFFSVFNHLFFNQKRKKTNERINKIEKLRHYDFHSKDEQELISIVVDDEIEWLR